MKIELLIAIMALGIIGCKDKKKNESPEPVNTTPAVVCFNSNNNGTYTAGIGAIQNGTVTTSFTNGTVTIGRTACQEVSISLKSSAGNRTELAKNVALNSSNVYEGTVSTGNITMLFGSSLQAKALGSFTFTGNK